MKTVNWIPWSVAAALIAMTAGCQDQNAKPAAQVVRSEDFAPEQTSQVKRMVEAQSASGARTEATLHPVHFDNHGSLNSLGHYKLDLMLSDDAAWDPLVVYLDLAEAESTNVSRQSVKAYLKSRGLTDSQIRLMDGPSPHSLSPAASAVTAYRGTPSQTSTEQSPSAPMGTAQPAYSSK